MMALDEIRQAEIEMDMELGPIEECYMFLQRCGVHVAKEEMESVDSLRYTFKKLISQAVSTNTKCVHNCLLSQNSLRCIYEGLLIVMID